MRRIVDAATINGLFFYIVSFFYVMTFYYDISGLILYMVLVTLWIFWRARWAEWASQDYCYSLCWMLRQTEGLGQRYETSGDFARPLTVTISSGRHRRSPWSVAVKSLGVCGHDAEGRSRILFKYSLLCVESEESRWASPS